MKKKTTRITIMTTLVIVAVVSYYAYLSNRNMKSHEETIPTFVENTLSRNLENNYPPTPKEVLRYYNEIQKCLYNEECTDEQLDSLILKVRELYDRELLDNNSLEAQSLQIRQEIKLYKEKKRKITSMAVASSANVIYDTIDGYEFAKLNCGYNVMEGNNNNPTTQVFLLRKDDERKWKIYGWKIMDDFQISQNESE